MKPKVKKKLDLTKVRTRFEPPTLEEAIFAAQGLTSDVEHQVAIASELTGKPEEEVRQVAQRMRSSSHRSISAGRSGPQRAVVVEKRSPGGIVRPGVLHG
jgi:hypothetical protein